jgi:hypothetical protein
MATKRAKMTRDSAAAKKLTPAQYRHKFGTIATPEDVERHNQFVAGEKMRRGYLMGLEDGYARANLNDPHGSGGDYAEFQKVMAAAQQFVMDKGEEMFEQFVLKVSYDKDGKRSANFGVNTPGRLV